MTLAGRSLPPRHDDDGARALDRPRVHERGEKRRFTNTTPA